MRNNCCRVYLDNNCIAAVARGVSSAEVAAFLPARFPGDRPKPRNLRAVSHVRSKLNLAGPPIAL